MVSRSLPSSPSSQPASSALPSFLLEPDEMEKVEKKKGLKNRFIFAFFLKFFQHEGRFPQKQDSFSDLPLQELACQLGSTAFDAQNFLATYRSWDHRTLKRFRSEVRQYFCFREPCQADRQPFIDWLHKRVFPQAPSKDQILEQSYLYFRERCCEPFAIQELEKILRSAHHQFEDTFFQTIVKALPADTRKAFDTFLNNDTTEEEIGEELEEGQEEQKAKEKGKEKRQGKGKKEGEPTIDNSPLTLNELKKETAELKMDAILYEVRKYQTLQFLTLNLPKNLESFGPRNLLEKYYRRFVAEFPSHTVAHKPLIQYATMAIFCVLRSQIAADTLTDLLLQLLHRIEKKAEKQVKNYVLSEVKKVDGKFDTLFLLADTSLSKPLGIIQEEIYATVSQERLKDIVDDLQHRGKWYQNQVRARALSLYSHTNRRLVWTLLKALPLQMEEGPYKEVLQALAWLREKKKLGGEGGPEVGKSQDDGQGGTNKIEGSSGCETDDERPPINKKTNTEIDEATNTKAEEKKGRQRYTEIPFSSAIPPAWHPFVCLKKKPDDKEFDLNIVAYELGLLERLAREVGCKNIWVEGGYRYRNPLEDFPKDFDDNPDFYFQLLNLPFEAKAFTGPLRKQVEENLNALNDSILSNPKVKIIEKKKKRFIQISPSLPQIESINLKFLKKEITRRWGPLSLMDILKEADDRIGFTKRFHSVFSREMIPFETLRRRLLLCLYGMGTNIGFKRVSAGQDDDTHSDLRYIRRRYMSCYAVRAAIQDMVNEVLASRDPKVWGVQITGCACDSKKVSVWDQNLMVEWHMRYQGRGVMIYWHVDKKAMCIYSHLKTCSSSEVGAMMRGFLNHDTMMDMNQLYVDTHGQSTIGFAFSYLLHFELLSRLKNIHKQKLYCTARSHKGLYPNLTPILASDPINWALIEKHYREMVKYVAALKTGAVQAEVIMKRLSSDNTMHPVYQALLELGKAVKTLFLCRYLSSEELRIEIHEALNVVERVNGLMGFIYYGKLGEISTNNREDQELSLLCLHLLQVCMVYITTLMIQEVLRSPDWKYPLTLEDKRALTPLLHSHITPYGLIVLNMDYRIPLQPFKHFNKPLLARRQR
jgi:TnpA family transposase